MVYICTFILLPYNTDFSCLLFSVNSIERCIQFSFKSKIDNFLSVLEILISKHIDWFSTTVLSKSFSVFLPPHVLSNYTSQQKMAAFCNYVCHALHI